MQHFYVFDEHTDYIAECIKLGLTPVYDKGGDVNYFVHHQKKYIVLSVHECYSGWTTTIMALPCLGYGKLIQLLETTKIYDEKVGCIGMLLKKYNSLFLEYVQKSPSKCVKKLKRIIFKDIAPNSTYVSQMEDLIEFCKN